MVKRLLVLEDGTVFEGTGFGADTYVSGELVLNSAMTGYQELITDQSYKGQILAFTFPVIGTTGINRDDYESIFPGCLAVVVHQLVSHPSNWRKQLSLDAYLKKHNIPGIQGIDTRKLAKIVTEHGSMKATVVNEGDAIEHILDQLRATVLPFDQVRQVSTKTPYAAPGFGKSIVLIDLGLRHSVLRQLIARGCNVTVVPYSIKLKELKDLQPDGIILSSGPGNPHHIDSICQVIAKIDPHIPIMGIGLGAELLALAHGGSLNNLKRPHRGLNIPVKEVATGKVEITSQNHQYNIERDTLPRDFLITHEELHDHSIEAFRHRYLPLIGVLYHIESSPGPRESLYFYDEFMDLIESKLDERREELWS